MKTTTVTKYFTFALVFCACSSVWADEVTRDELRPGMCVSDAFSKVYLTDPLAKSEEGVRYSCLVTCLNQQNIKSNIRVVHTESTAISYSGTDEMNRMKCKGVRIDVKKTELGYVLDQKIHSNAFYAQISGIPELVQWSRTQDGRIPEDVIREMKADMKLKFRQTGEALLQQQGQSPAILSFASQLVQLSADTSQAESTLKDILNKIRTKYVPTEFDEVLLLQFVSGYADFLLN